MATTRLMPLHTGKGRTVGQAISAIIDYTENPQKTDGGRLITSWQCDSRIADAEFLFTKNQYIQKTGRVRGEDDVIAYHLRQSFVPGEITPEDANRLGCELAKRFTKGNHAYIVCTRDAAAFYGVEVKRNGMACCPFHDDKNPSMKVDQRFHCFGCGEDGDVIDFTAKLFDLSPKEAAEKLAQDFGLIYDSQAPPRRRYVRQKTEAQKFREDRQRCYRVLSDYYYLLKKWEADNSPDRKSVV